MPQRDSSAVVLGASMSGLLAARALSGHVARVTLVERDALPERDESRKGVPQSNHAHGLLASGYQAMDEYFPGMMDELEALGAPRGDVVGDFLWFQYGRWKLRHDSGLRGITVSRPCLEAAIRRRVKTLPNVTFLEGTEGVKPAFDTGTGRVTGLVVRSKGGTVQETLGADLVVDASGRGSLSPRWLEEAGCGHPDEITVKVNVGYATRTFARKPGEFFGSMGGIISGTPPASTRYGAVLAAEHARWVVTLVGILSDYPPTDEPGWVAFAASLPIAAVHQLVTSAQPPHGHRELSVSGEPAAALRAPAALSVWLSGHRRRRVQLQSDLRPGDVGGGDRGAGARGVPGGRARRTVAPLLRAGAPDRRHPLGDRDRRRSPVPASRGQAPSRVRAHQPLPRACARGRVVRSGRLQEVLRRAEPARAAPFIDVAPSRLARARARDAQGRKLAVGDEAACLSGRGRHGSPGYVR